MPSPATLSFFERPLLMVLVLLLPVCGALLVRMRRRLHETTLVWPWNWSLLAMAGVAACEFGLATAPPTTVAWGTAVRLASAALALCPWMSLLGARRPHHLAWQWIVLTFWAVLIWPAGAALVTGRSIDMHGVLQGFVVLLIAVQTINGWPTRHAAAATIQGIGQVLLWSAPLAWLQTLQFSLDAPTQAQLGAVFYMVGTGWYWTRAASHGSSTASEEDAWETHSRAWRRFRDDYGLLWALRMRERFNATAQQCGWQTRLQWSGLSLPQQQAPANADQEKKQAENALQQLLWRFVSAAWFAR